MNKLINIVLPVYNEEKRLANGIEKLINYLDDVQFYSYIITIADNASCDKTEEIAREYCGKVDRITYFKISEQGLGAAFREACKRNKCPIIGYMDIDMSTDLSAFAHVIALFEKDGDIEIINGSRYNSESQLIGRNFFRKFIGYALVFLLKCVFNMKASDAICGFKFFDAHVADELLKESTQESGWFLIIEMLLRAEKEKRHIYEMPVKWTYYGESKVHIVETTINYIKNIIRLRGRFIIEKIRS